MPDFSLARDCKKIDSGTFEFFTEKINGKARASRPDYQASENDNVLVRGVERDRGGLGYFGLSYYVENKPFLGFVLNTRRRSRHARATAADHLSR